MIENLKAFDEYLIHAINDLSGVGVIDQFMIVISSAWLWTTFGVVMSLLLIRQRNTKGLAIMLTGLMALCLTDYISFELVKPIFRRERPCWELQGIHWVQGSCGGSYGFTSNHAANAAAVIMTLFLFRDHVPRWFLIVASSAAFLVGFSRVYLGVHYPGDVFGGFVLGAGIAGLLQKTPVHKWSEFISEKICHIMSSPGA